MLNSFCFLVLFIAVKSDSKFTLYHMGILLLLFNLPRKKYRRLTCLISFLLQRNYGMNFRFSGNNGKIECALRRDEFRHISLFALM